MDKCWFVLKQEHYPPPHLPESGIGVANGAICLGHIVPDATNLDNVINRDEEGITFTPAVPIYHTASWGLDWKRDTGQEAASAASMTTPTGAGLPVSVEQQTKTAFAHTEKNHKEFDTLDRYIIQVDRSFIRNILEDREVVEHIERTKGIRLLGGQWSVFMITGIIVARGGKGKFGENKIFEVASSTKANMANAASATAAGYFSKKNNSYLSAQKASDFVWAVRLTKIWKGVMDKRWEFRVMSKGATFSLDNERAWRDEIQYALSQELSNHGAFQTMELSDEEGMIVY
ncbi:hypothetical protein MKX08_001108 [Trichoderma sp. CBMAI-0020]|nr:hypothetical protein MKX08_001108 [Trichoderma sp. CBMAI-0020]